MTRITRPLTEIARPPSDDARNGFNTTIFSLLLLVGVHLLVDLFASVINPLWRALEEHLGLQPGGALWIFVAWSIATSFTQFAFGWWADRGGGRWLVWIGAAATIVCLSCVGLAGSTGVLAALLVLGGLGVAAFHPEAAAMAGALLPGHRSRVMAIFALGGYFGQSIGPYYSGTVTERLGLSGLAWGAAWGGALLLGLAFVWSRSSKPLVIPPVPPAERDGTGGHVVWRRMVLLLVVGSLRIMPAMGILLALVYLLEAQQVASSTIGAVQSAFMAGIGGGGMVCALLVSPRWERIVLWLMPIAAAAVLLFLPGLGGTQLMIAVAIAGFLHGIGMPVFISYGQQLLPSGERVASSITMGVCWGVAGGMVAAAVRWYQQAESLERIFVFFAAISALSGILCLSLPKVETAVIEGR